MSDWTSGFLVGLLAGMPLFGCLGALVIVLVASAKRADTNAPTSEERHL